MEQDVVFCSSTLKTKSRKHKHFTPPPGQGRFLRLWTRLQLMVLRWAQGPAQPRPAPASNTSRCPGVAWYQRALPGPQGELRTAIRPAGSPQHAKTYRPSVSRVGHDQAIESHTSPVSQRQRGLERGKRKCVRQVQKVGAQCRAPPLGRASSAWSPASRPQARPCRSKPRPSHL